MRVPICPNSISETQQGNQETYTEMWRESPFPSPPPHHPQIMMAKCASVYLIYSFVDLSLGRKRGWDGNSQSRPVSEKNDLNKILQVELYNCKFLNLEDVEPWVRKQWSYERIRSVFVYMDYMCAVSSPGLNPQLSLDLKLFLWPHEVINHCQFSQKHGKA